MPDLLDDFTAFLIQTVIFVLITLAIGALLLIAISFWSEL
jgi:hypothetical protein